MLPQGLDFIMDSYGEVCFLGISYSIITIYVMKLERNEYNFIQKQAISFFV